MNRNAANVSFYCRESKKNKDGTAPIEISLVINGKRCYVQLPGKEAPATFKREINSKKDNDLKDYLRSVRVRLNEIETAFLRDGQALTAESLRHYFKTGGFVIYTAGGMDWQAKRLEGKVFTVRFIDSAGQIHLEETGLALIPGVDEYEIAK